MLSSILQFSSVAQLPLAQAGQLLLVTGISFAVITLVSSTYRFHRMIQLSEEALTTVEDCNDFFFIQVTRYLSKINRASSGFGVFVVQFRTEEPGKRRVQEELLNELKKIVRIAHDKGCLFRDDCVAAIIDTDESNIPAVAQRMVADLKKAAAAVPGINALRIGISSFPTHGANTQQIIDAATGALETVSFENPLPFCIAASSAAPANEKTAGELGVLSREDKNAALDPLTGVLKPASVGSYMRKYLDEIRRKKEPAALLCVGINRIDEIIQLHGETAAGDVTAGVSGVLQRLTRDCDLIGRFHRDDFLVLAPCTLQQGQMLAVRLREAVQKEVFSSGGKRIKASVSIGLTAHPEHGRNLRTLFGGAHRALEVVRDWNTSACLVYDPLQHGKKTAHETRR
ncbi:MAG: GGDEF domain-containing protein [Kiritimatiellales bacterium]|jgi:diguanylate cyclase (GGDEF)-like protein